MPMKMTSAYANKLLKQLNEEKEYWTNKEKTSCTYTVTPGEEEVIPEYDYEETAQHIDDLNEQIIKIKHAINKANVESEISFNNGKEFIVMTVDAVLVRMAQLSKRKDMLDYMRKLPARRKKESRFGESTPDYECINFDSDLIKSEFDKISKEIMEMQIALDKHNQTVEFDVDI